MTVSRFSRSARAPTDECTLFTRRSPEVRRGLATAVVMAVVMMAACDMSHDYREESRLPSPTGSAIAIVYSDMGGGAAGWCFLNVAIVAKDAPVDVATLDRNALVFNGSCRADPKV